MKLRLLIARLESDIFVTEKELQELKKRKNQVKMYFGFEYEHFQVVEHNKEIYINVDSTLEILEFLEINNLMNKQIKIFMV